MKFIIRRGPRKPRIGSRRWREKWLARLVWMVGYKEKWYETRFQKDDKGKEIRVTTIVLVD